MKKRIVIDVQEYCKKCKKQSCRTEYCWLKSKKDEERFEQLPENWEELKELCRWLENVSIHDVGGYIKLSINGNLIYFFIAGEMEGKIDITNNTFLERFCVIQKATPQQMWQIIKSLTGDQK